MIEWKQLDEAPDYWINNRGEVLSKRVRNKEKLCKIHTNPYTGYQQVCLITSEKGEPYKKFTFYPHQLVARYFVDNPNDFKTVHHKDHNKINNHYWNLQWVSQEQNIHAYYHSDEKNKPRSMKSIEVWDVKGNYIDTFPSINAAAKAMNYSPATVWRQVKGKIKNPKRHLFNYTID